MFNIFFSEKARKQLKKLDDVPRERILKKVYSIRKNPFSYLKRLHGSKLWRLRVEDYRIIMDIVVVDTKIFVLRVDKRSRVYDR